MGQQQSPTYDPFAGIKDWYRCRELDGVGGRCQLVVDHPGEHILERDGSLTGMPWRFRPRIGPFMYVPTHRRRQPTLIGDLLTVGFALLLLAYLLAALILKL